MQLPLVLRFPQILKSQLKKLSQSYCDAIAEFGYQAKHYPVFPMKVNPRREVVEDSYVTHPPSRRSGMWLQTELYAASSPSNKIRNRFCCAMGSKRGLHSNSVAGTQAGKRVIIIVEKLNELKWSCDSIKN